MNKFVYTKYLPVGIDRLHHYIYTTERFLDYLHKNFNGADYSMSTVKLPTNLFLMIRGVYDLPYPKFILCKDLVNGVLIREDGEEEDIPLEELSKPSFDMLKEEYNYLMLTHSDDEKIYSRLSRCLDMLEESNHK